MKKLSIFITVLLSINVLAMEQKKASSGPTENNNVIFVASEPEKKVRGPYGKACDFCRYKHAKCSGMPCDLCANAQIRCTRNEVNKFQKGIGSINPKNTSRKTSRKRANDQENRQAIIETPKKPKIVNLETPAMDSSPEVEITGEKPAPAAPPVFLKPNAVIFRPTTEAVAPSPTVGSLQKECEIHVKMPSTSYPRQISITINENIPAFPQPSASALTVKASHPVAKQFLPYPYHQVPIYPLPEELVTILRTPHDPKKFRESFCFPSPHDTVHGAINGYDYEEEDDDDDEASDEEHDCEEGIPPQRVSNWGGFPPGFFSNF